MLHVDTSFAPSMFRFMACFCFTAGCPLCHGVVSDTASSAGVGVALRGTRGLLGSGASCNCLLAGCRDCGADTLAVPGKRRRGEGVRIGPIPFISRTTGSQCSCVVDPFVRCPLHPCRCKLCQDRPSRESPPCAWQKSNQLFIVMHNLDVVCCGPVYCQTHAVPWRSPSRRNRLNIVECLRRQRPHLNASLVVLDLSQNLFRSGLSWDGCVPTLATTSMIFSMGLGVQLSVPKLAELMGFRWKSHVWNLMTFPQWRIRLGNSMHVVVIGAVIISALCAGQPPSNVAQESSLGFPRSALRSHLREDAPPQIATMIRQLVGFLSFGCGEWTITLHTDCSGIEAVGISLHYVATELAKYNYFLRVHHTSACDNDAHVQRYIQTVVGCRLFRDVLGREWCNGVCMSEDVCGRKQRVPRDVGLYVAGFSCEPSAHAMQTVVVFLNKRRRCFTPSGTTSSMLSHA